MLRWQNGRLDSKGDKLGVQPQFQAQKASRPTDTYSLFVFIDVHCMSDFRKSPLGKLGGCKIFCVTQGNSATRFHSWNMSSYSFCSPFFECITQTFTRDTVIRCNSEVGTC